MPENNLLPVRIVHPSRDFYHKSEKRGGGVRFFIPYDTPKYREHQRKLLFEIKNVERNLEDNFNKYPEVPSVLKAQLISKAWAKSHRPNNIFELETCPIIGLDRMGELLISATKPGLNKLKKRIGEPKNKTQKANLTTVAKFQAYDLKDKLMGIDIETLKNKAKRDKVTILKIILFDHQNSEINKIVKREFLDFVSDLKLNIKDITKMENFAIYKLIGANEDQIKKLCYHPSVRTVSYFPTFKIVKPRELVIKGKKFQTIKPVETEEYPKIGIIDSGIPDEHPYLKPWIVDRKRFVPEVYSDFNHGTFVAGLACFGQQINGNNICPDKDNIKLIDIHLLPDENSGEGVTEDDLIDMLQSSIPNLSEKHNTKIWNMSAGFEVTADNNRFSSLAIFLDKFQDKNKIIFTIPSGNFISTSYRKWPPQIDFNNQDKIQIPADSVRAITVGSLACTQNPNSIVDVNQPTPYSCKGPGPAFIPKPELVHYSGNFSINMGIPDITGQGIRSFDENGAIVEGIGTSYSSPLVARTLSLVHHNLYPEPSSLLIKAMTFHNSRLPTNIGKTEEIFPYVGFGMPLDLNHILHCKDSEITLIFEQEIYEGIILEYPFVWPKSLTDNSGKCRGKVKVTLVADTPLDESYGSEYVRANVDVSLQSIIYKKKGKKKVKYHLHEIPKTKDLKKIYEKEIIEHGFKWKPVKRYEANLKKISAKDWRIRVYLLLRDGVKLGEKPVKFALIFTLFDPDKKAPVYNEVVASLRTRGVITSPIQLRSKVRQKVRT